MSKTPPKPTKVVCELPDPVQLQPAIPHVKGDGNKDLPVSKLLGTAGTLTSFLFLAHLWCVQCACSNVPKVKVKLKLNMVQVKNLSSSLFLSKRFKIRQGVNRFACLLIHFPTNFRIGQSATMKQGKRNLCSVSSSFAK